jgi:hypothetical protein
MRHLTKQQAQELAKDVELAGNSILEGLQALREELNESRNLFRPVYLSAVNRKLSNIYVRYEYQSDFRLKIWFKLYSSRNGMKFIHPTDFLEKVFDLDIRITPHLTPRLNREWRVGEDIQNECKWHEERVLKTIAQYKDAARHHSTYLSKLTKLEATIAKRCEDLNPLFVKQIKIPEV